MGYFIRALPKKKSSPRWKVQYVSYKKEHVKDSQAQCPQRTWDLQRARWSGLGFKASMTLEQAKARQKQLNAQLDIKRQEERRQKIENSLRLFEKKCIGFLPEIYREEFEKRYFSGVYLNRTLRNKSLCHWRAAQKIVLELQLEPCDWYDEYQKFYDYFCQRRWSFSYSQKILSIINLWGFFVSRKLGTPFFSIPRPKGYEKSRILDSYFQKSDRGKQSDPITPQQLEAARGKLKLNHYNWLYLSVWLGLRPNEVDQLKNKEYFRPLQAEDGTTILWVYQTKLISVPPHYRWKLIPLIMPQQKTVTQIIKQRNFQRPLVKTVKRIFGAQTRLYGGRKGFTDLMLSHGQDFVNISQWMGHSSISRTWISYKNKIQVHYKLVA